MSLIACHRITSALAFASLIISLSACGGGGSGGGGGSNATSSNALNLTGAPNFGSMAQGIAQTQPFPTIPVTGIPVPTNGTPVVQPAMFGSSGANAQDFIELRFNLPLQASSVGLNGPTPGIVIEDSTGLPVPLRLDSSGLLDSANTIVDNIAPATLRVYVDSDQSLATPERFLSDSYVIRLFASRLRSFAGVPFCVSGTNASCTNTYEPLIPFAVQADALPLRLATVNPSAPSANSESVATSSEVTLNFSEAIDFTSLVGLANVSTLDPFISKPLPMAYAVPANLCSTTPVPPAIVDGNLYLNYTPFTDPATGQFETLPAGCAIIAYMPDPILNPTQVRLRPVDQTALSGTNGGGVFQNYASNPVRFPIQSTDPQQNGALLTLPPIFPFPGSREPSNQDPAGQNNHLATLDIVVMQQGFAPFTNAGPRPVFPAGSQTCYPATTNLSGIATGALDRSGNPLQEFFWLRFSYATGPTPARNPNVPHATFVGQQSGGLPGISVLNAAGITTNLITTLPNSGAPVTYGTLVTGQMSIAPNPLRNLDVVGVPLDLEVGAFIDTTGTNNITNPGLASTGTPGVPDTQNGTTPTSLVPALGVAFPVVQQPWGSYLYVADGSNDQVRVLNSYDFSLVGTIVGMPAPGGLGITPNLQDLYVSNRDQASVTVVNANPSSPFFNQIIGTIAVGNGPRAVSVQPGGEDVFVANFAENTYSIIDAQLQQERTRRTSGLGPTDIFITNRSAGTAAYLAFITNLFSNDVTVYESDSPLVPSNGPQGNEVALVGGFAGPSHGCWNWQSNVTFTQEPGAYIANSQGRSVDELTLFNFTLGPPPGFPGPAGRRDFHIRKSFSSFADPTVGDTAPSDASVESHSGLYNGFFPVPGTFTISNNKALADPAVGGGVPSVVLVSFPGAGKIVGYNYNSTAILGSVDAPGCDFLQSYYDQ